MKQNHQIGIEHHQRKAFQVKGTYYSKFFDIFESKKNGIYRSHFELNKLSKTSILRTNEQGVVLIMSLKMKMKLRVI